VGRSPLILSGACGCIAGAGMALAIRALKGRY